MGWPQAPLLTGQLGLSEEIPVNSPYILLLLFVVKGALLGLLKDCWSCGRRGVTDPTGLAVPSPWLGLLAAPGCCVHSPASRAWAAGPQFRPAGGERRPAGDENSPCSSEEVCVSGANLSPLFSCPIAGRQLSPAATGHPASKRNQDGLPGGGSTTRFCDPKGEHLRTPVSPPHPRAEHRHELRAVFTSPRSMSVLSLVTFLAPAAALGSCSAGHTALGSAPDFPPALQLHSPAPTCSPAQCPLLPGAPRHPPDTPSCSCHTWGLHPMVVAAAVSSSSAPTP